MAIRFSISNAGMLPKTINGCQSISANTKTQLFEIAVLFMAGMNQMNGDYRN